MGLGTRAYNKREFWACHVRDGHRVPCSKCITVLLLKDLWPLGLLDMLNVGHMKPERT